jgi:hypothetical protein
MTQEQINPERLRVDGWRALPRETPIDAWRQLHYAAQIASELAKGWGEPAADDSHTSLEWGGTQSLAGPTVVRGMCALLDTVQLAVKILYAGESLPRLELRGRTLAEGLSWISREAELIAGPMRQRPVPAPDLPDHPLVRGAEFSARVDHCAGVSTLYDMTSQTLDALGRVVPGAQPVRVWPHHFDIAMLIELEHDGTGSATRTLGVGLTPPDSLIDDGYWYVSPWAKGAFPDRTWPDLPSGEWLDREGTPPMAVLRVREVVTLAHDKEQAAALSAFIAAAVNAAI